MAPKLDITGHIFKRWTVLEYSHKTRTRRHFWKCRCACGVERTVEQSNLLRGATRSCGCWNREVLGKRTTTHGRSRTPTYRTWAGMFERCTRVAHKDYALYGGRGITVCERWRSFENFLADMGERPAPNSSIDRIDNNGNYEPGNCRWVTQKEQCRNKRNNKRLTINGRTQTIAEWTEEYGLHRGIIRHRLKAGRSGEDLIVPSRRARAYEREMLAALPY